MIDTTATDNEAQARAAEARIHATREEQRAYSRAKSSERSAGTPPLTSISNLAD